MVQISRWRPPNFSSRCKLYHAAISIAQFGRALIALAGWTCGTEIAQPLELGWKSAHCSIFLRKGSYVAFASPALSRVLLVLVSAVGLRPASR